jgi:hypothetical protein
MPFKMLPRIYWSVLEVSKDPCAFSSALGSREPLGPEDEGAMVLSNVRKCLPNEAQQHRSNTAVTLVLIAFVPGSPMCCTFNCVGHVPGGVGSRLRVTVFRVLGCHGVYGALVPTFGTNFCLQVLS